jgi:MOSC domain-containing protein YiiM
MILPKGSPMQKLMDTLPQQGTVVWIGTRPEHRAVMKEHTKVDAITDLGLAGDHSMKKGSKRQVTLIQLEHLKAIASIMKSEVLAPALVRRNLVIQGFNLLAFKDKQFIVGNTLLEYTGECHPCSRMEEHLGAGGYNAVRGHGGITARILRGGTIQLSDVVKVFS